MLCLAVFFGIASKATADCGQPKCVSDNQVKVCTCVPYPLIKKIQGCVYVSKTNSCQYPYRLDSDYDQDPTDLSSSPNSDPRPPSSGVVAPSIGNPAP